MSIEASKNETHRHIRRVQELLMGMVQNLQQRLLIHDTTKLLPPEADIFAEATGKLKGLTYGSDEYMEQLAKMKPALDHHYACNSHHPEHYGEAGINGMDLLDLLEMMVDWKAATERHADGCLFKSLEHNKERFDISDQLQTILTNTAVRYLTEPMQQSERVSAEELIQAESELATRQLKDIVDTGVTESSPNA
jgi:hypothetical protein